MSDRWFSFLLFLLSFAYEILGLQIKTPLSYDPLGPKPLPLLLGGSLICLTLILLTYPQKSENQYKNYTFGTIRLFAILCLYLATWLPLGFLLSSTICLYLMARQFHCSWMQGLMAALIISVSYYGLFHFILRIPLPLGSIFVFAKG